jgi:hypothetical protein
MVAVRGIYQGGDTVKLDASSVSVHEPYEVVVAFLNPLQQPDNAGETAEEKLVRRQKAFQHFMQYKGTLPVDFDYKKELAEYRDERYEYID